MAEQILIVEDEADLANTVAFNLEQEGFRPKIVGTGAQVGASFTLGGVAAVAWFALGPQEVYRPAYAASPAYLRAMNLGNALIPSARITNITVNSTQVIQVYANPRQGALVAMPAADFARSRPVAAAAPRYWASHIAPPRRSARPPPAPAGNQ